ncbi:MAG TPA: YggT family protein [Actinomycetota bacterium]|jgi:YggT family protein|nr:YggT family protein [Actinomycetota bacterium]
MVASSNPLQSAFCLALTLAWLLLLARVIVSWVVFAGWRPPSTGPVRSAYDLLDNVTDWAIKPLRKIVPPAGMFDMSVLVAFIIIFVARVAFC